MELAAFYETYQRLLAEAGLVDFGDQIHRALSRLRDSAPALLARLRARYRYVLVDEFQDTNHAQLELVRLLAGGGPGPNITVVGDDDQAIYRWRGAASANLLAFRRFYPGAREVVLNENHRSTQVILDASARLISYNNPHRLEVVAGIDKRLRSARSAGPAVVHLRYDTVSAEADGVAALVGARLQAGYRPRDVALLVRSNRDADPFLRALNMRGIAHRFSGSRGLYAREEVRLLIAFLRTLANPADSISVFYLAASELYRAARARAAAAQPPRAPQEPPAARGAARPARRRGAGGHRRRHARERRAPAGRPRGRGRGRPAAAHGRGPVQVPAGVGPARRAARARPAPKRSSRSATSRASSTPCARTARPPSTTACPAFVEHLDLLREAGDDPAVAEADPDDDAVSVLTVHKAKGLEFGVVFLVGCAQDRFPLRRARGARWSCRRTC